MHVMVAADKDVADRKGYDDFFKLDPLLWQGLRERDPQDVCGSAWVEHEKGRGYCFFFLGQECVVNPFEQTILFRERDAYRKGSFQEALVVLTYMVKAVPIPPSGKMVAEKELKGGSRFFRGPHVLLTLPLTYRYKDFPQDFLAAGVALGGMVQDYGNAAFKLRPLPKVPVVYILYRGDEEFDANIVVTFDETIDRHLPLDVIWALVNVTSMRLIDFAP
jgi:hypothetical protein